MLKHKTWCWINLSAGMMALQRSQGIGFFVCVLFLGAAAPPEVSTSSGAAAWVGVFGLKGM